jgi:hypothetical protein
MHLLVTPEPSPRPELEAAEDGAEGEAEGEAGEGSLNLGQIHAIMPPLHRLAEHHLPEHAPRVNSVRLEADGGGGMQFHSFVTKTRMVSWRQEAHHGKKARRAMLKGFALWALGIALLITNWLWLTVFFALFSQAVSRTAAVTEIGSWGIFFDAVQFVLIQLTVKVLKKGEKERVGSNLTSFDRFHLVNLAKFHFVSHLSNARLPLHYLWFFSCCGDVLQIASCADSTVWVLSTGSCCR